MGEITKLTLVNLVSKIKSKEISAVEACNDYTSRIVKSKKLNTFVTETLEQAISSAKKIDNNNLKEGILSGQNSFFEIIIVNFFCRTNSLL